MKRLIILAGILAGLGCSAPRTDTPDAAVTNDAGASDAGSNDHSGRTDGWPSDATAWPNAPGGFRTILDDPLDSVTKYPWLVGNLGTGTTLEQEVGAPGGGNGFLRFHYPNGYTGGGDPGYVSYEQDNTGTQAYVGFWLRANDWQGHPTGVNKIGFLWNGSQSPMVVLNMDTDGGDPISPQIIVQNTAERVYTPDGAYRVPQNRNTVTIKRGEWSQWEAYFQMNSGNNKDGIMRLWVNGTLLTEITDYQFTSTSQAKTWGIRSLRPVWGGLGGKVSRSDMSLDIAHYFSSSVP
jgi:hypothetical protein